METCCYSDFSERPSGNTGEKNSHIIISEFFISALNWSLSDSKTPQFSKKF